EWDVQVVNSKVRYAHTIARSVTREKKYQSYVAQVSPRWLKEMFEEDQQEVAGGTMLWMILVRSGGAVC
ncbi:unnamed protein product, partial [Brassica oleracea var. botrytis]